MTFVKGKLVFDEVCEDFFTMGILDVNEGSFDVVVRGEMGFDEEKKFFLVIILVNGLDGVVAADILTALYGESLVVDVDIEEDFVFTLSDQKVLRFYVLQKLR